MEHIITQLATTLGQGPFIADNQGRYLIRIDGFSLFLNRRGQEFLLSSPLDWNSEDKMSNSSDLLSRLASQVISWARRYPQALVINKAGQLALEARLEAGTTDIASLEQAIMAQIGILEHLSPQLKEASIQPQWKQAVWRP